MKHTRELNLELGWPTVDQALRRLDAELEAALSGGGRRAGADRRLSAGGAVLHL